MSGEIDRSLLEEWALAYLGRYSGSTGDLRRVLMRRTRRRLGGDRERIAAAAALIEALILRYREARLLDDAAFAAARARRDAVRGRPPRRIAAALAAKGVGAEDAAAALAALREGGADPEITAAVAFARRRRLGPYRAGPAERERDMAAFARGGFSRRAAATVLDCADAAAAAALLIDNP